MRIIFSRKGFDSASGGGPSPIVDGRPVSLPIPASRHSRTTWDDLGLGDHVAEASRGKLGGAGLCHDDPMFVEKEGGTECLFGQCGAAQTHLANQGVGHGDVFVFFGLFKAPDEPPHHGIFGWMRIESMTRLADCSASELAEFDRLDHPHAIGLHAGNDTIYRGPGACARTAHPDLRLTAPGASPSLWAIPRWLRETGLSYHDRPDRWKRGPRLQSVARGQEFVADIGRRSAPRRWLDRVIEVMDQD